MKTKILKTTFLVLLYLATNYGYSQNSKCAFPSSPDGKFKAVKVKKNGIHYAVINVAKGDTLFIARAKFYDANDVKAGAFGKIKGKLCFVSIYHYGDTKTSWACIFSMESFKEITPKETSGYIHSACWTFDQ